MLISTVTSFLKEVALRSNDGGLQKLCFFILYQSSVSLNARQLLSKGAFDKQIHIDIKSNVILSETKDLTIVKILRLTLRMTFLLYDVTLRSVVVQV